MSFEINTYGEIKKKQRKVAFVLSGGGVRGSFQVGFLKAAREYGFSPDIITGVSVGALNAAAYIQDDHDRLEALWENMSFESIYGDGGKQDGRMDNVGQFIRFTLEWLFNQRDRSGKLKKAGQAMGVKPVGLEKIVYGMLDEDKVRSSKIDFAINLTQVYERGIGFTRMREKTLTKEEIPLGQMAEYILGTSAFWPLFESKEIDGNIYIDGGVSNNIPIEKALEMGANEIIVVRAGSGAGRERKARKRRVLSGVKDVRVVTMGMDFDLGRPVTFDNKVSRQGLEAGYIVGKRFFKEYGKLINLRDKTLAG